MIVESGLKISKEKAATTVHFFIVLIAGLSTVLRPSIESKVTLFRILLPFLFLWLFTINTRRAIKLSVIIGVFLVYAISVSYLSRFHTFNIVFSLYYITVFFFFFYYREVVRICGKQNLYTALSWLFKALIVLGFLQLVFGGIYLNTQNRLPAVNIFFWNENEFSSVLAIFSPLFFLKEKTYLKYVWLGASLYLMAFNDAKLAVLSVIIFFGGYVIMKIKLFRIRYLGFGLLGIFTILLLFFIREYTIQGKYTIEYFLERLGSNLWLLEPLEHIGTFNARSNSIIVGAKETINSFFLGIGPGNSLTMMQELVIPGTEKYTALSMHNFTLQIVVEMGFFGIATLTAFFLKIKRAALASMYPANLVYLFFISCLVSITLLSGAWSNYFYLFILFYAIDFFGKNE